MAHCYPHSHRDHLLLLRGVMHVLLELHLRDARRGARARLLGEGILLVSGIGERRLLVVVDLIDDDVRVGGATLDPGRAGLLRLLLSVGLRLQLLGRIVHVELVLAQHRNGHPAVLGEDVADNEEAPLHVDRDDAHTCLHVAGRWAGGAQLCDGVQASRRRGLGGLAYRSGP